MHEKGVTFFSLLYRATYWINKCEYKLAPNYTFAWYGANNAWKLYVELFKVLKFNYFQSEPRGEPPIFLSYAWKRKYFKSQRIKGSRQYAGAGNIILFPQGVPRISLRRGITRPSHGVPKALPFSLGFKETLIHLGVPDVSSDPSYRDPVAKQILSKSFHINIF